MTRPSPIALPTRRRFLRASMAAGLALSATPAAFASGRIRRVGPNDRITVGVIGVGKQGKGLASRMARRGDAQVVAVADVVADRREDAKRRIEEVTADRDGSGTHSGCEMYHDFRELLARDDIDAVIIATPDHWHAIACVMAADAKKHIYCEKPLTHNIAQGRTIVEAVDRNGITFQTGSQQRSEYDGRFRRAVELVWNGRIGEVKTVRIGVGGPPRPIDLPEQEVPEGTDWDFWVGPAAFHPYNEVLCPEGVHDHFPKWRDYIPFGNGGIADMGAHHFDIAQWALKKDESGPVAIEPPEGDETHGLRFVYDNGVTMIHGGPDDCTFEGTEGIIRVSRNKFAAEPESIAEELPDDAERIQSMGDHFANFLDCVREGTRPVAPAEVGHRTATVCHLGVIGYTLRRPLRWDPAAERFEDDEEANGMRGEEPREPWRL